MIPRILVIYTVFMLLLTALSWYIEPKLNVYSDDEIRFGRQYAADMLALMESIQSEAAAIPGGDRTKLCDLYLDGEDKFRALKSAATHMKGEQAEDFVYALSLAEDWCRNSAEAAFRPTNKQAQILSGRRYEQAKAELTAIQTKQYKRKQ